MNKEKDLNVEISFELALQNHKKNNLLLAKNLYYEILKKKPNHVDSLNNLGMIFLQSKDFKNAKKFFEKTLEINPLNVMGYNNLGLVFKESSELQKAKTYYEKAIEIDPNYINAYNNLGVVLKRLGELDNSKICFEKAIKINPNIANLYNNLGVVFEELGKLKKAKKFTQKALEIDPNYVDAYWNLHSFATNIDEALTILKKLYKINNKHIRAKIMISALEAFKNNSEKFNFLDTTPESNHPYTRSIKWIFSLPKLPKIFFNRWDFYDGIIKISENSRPFYEFGVWYGMSFQYLINTFKKGFGFDTFTGLPESWHDSQPKGTYSSHGSIPKIKGGEFIVGNFNETLPKFFSEKRPLASIINLDADLYSSTLCALKYSNKVIDDKSILIFDEFLMHKNWEKDEYKALNDFCNNSNMTYEVLAVSFLTSQVAVKLRKER